MVGGIDHGIGIALFCIPWMHGRRIQFIFLLLQMPDFPEAFSLHHHSPDVQAKVNR